jgi:hypothetical protein
MLDADLFGLLGGDMTIGVLIELDGVVEVDCMESLCKMGEDCKRA